MDSEHEWESGPFDEFEVDEELEEKWLEEWEQVDRGAVDVLRTALSEHRGAAVPAEDARAVAAEVRERIRGGGFPMNWVAQAAGLEATRLPADDLDLLLTCTAATISPREETGLDSEEEAMLLSLEHADWLGSIVTAVRRGAGRDASPRSLAQGVFDCPEVEIEDGLEDDEEEHLATAFSIIMVPWMVMGIIDRDDRLTRLGRWLLPRGLARAWGGDFDAEPKPEPEPGG